MTPKSKGCARSTATPFAFASQQPQPRFIQTLASGDLYGAVAREVVEAYGDDILAHPVGTGPFRLVEWRRSSKIVLRRIPTYRHVHYDFEPAADDAEGQVLLASFKGRRLPMLDRVEVSVIDERSRAGSRSCKSSTTFSSGSRTIS